eukprot:1157346-Pelagomonas_calceolata.AAC.15
MLWCTLGKPMLAGLQCLLWGLLWATIEVFKDTADEKRKDYQSSHGKAFLPGRKRLRLPICRGCDTKGVLQFMILMFTHLPSTLYPIKEELSTPSPHVLTITCLCKMVHPRQQTALRGLPGRYLALALVSKGNLDDEGYVEALQRALAVQEELLLKVRGCCQLFALVVA